MFLLLLIGSIRVIDDDISFIIDISLGNIGVRLLTFVSSLSTYNTV